MPATYDDANLVVQLLIWANQMGLPEALATVMDEDFDPALATTADKAVRDLLGFGETVGTFVKQKVLDETLVHDLWWIEGMWARVGPAALRQRAQIGEKRLYENFEALAAAPAS